MAGRNGVKINAVEDEAAEPEVDKARVAVPEHSHPGESQSNGLSERSMRELIDEVRTLKMSTEQRLKERFEGAIAQHSSGDVLADRTCCLYAQPVQIGH